MDNNRFLRQLSRLSWLSNPTGHFWYQRVTAVMLVPLSVWLIILLTKALNAPYNETTQWLMSPLNMLMLTVWVVAVFFHAALGVQVVVEDYVSTLDARHSIIRVTKLIFLVLGLAAIAALLFIFLIR
jgi:succinate dehydrogenase / fumarate reductase membrane anchor subunit